MRGWEIGGQPNLQTGEEVFWSFAPENAYMDERDSRQTRMNGGFGVCMILKLIFF